MTSGGDAAGMNPAIKAAVDHARQLGMNPYVVYDGLEGLIDGKIKEATRELTNDMIYRGGTLLRSSRSKRFFDYEFRKQAYEHLKKRNIDKLDQYARESRMSVDDYLAEVVRRGWTAFYPIKSYQGGYQRAQEVGANGVALRPKTEDEDDSWFPMVSTSNNGE